MTEVKEKIPLIENSLISFEDTKLGAEVSTILVLMIWSVWFLGNKPIYHDPYLIPIRDKYHLILHFFFSFFFFAVDIIRICSFKVGL